MELIPILATIILMATISTFILAIGAYILYKVRERQGQQVEVSQPATLQAELLTPELIAEQLQAQEHQKAPGQIMFEPVRTPSQPSYRPQSEPIFVQQRAQAGPQPVPARNTPPAQQYNQPKRAEAHQQTMTAQTGDQKFMKYTSEGYVPAKENVKSQGAVKWR
ncbi:MAG: hypothetical protein COZ80_08870 [Ignavibacteria bacterium CG_4_8_14_3_um_filter_37_9]|nr:hypothetical protein [Ignavibacteria bacterium]OIO14256.1 MAG: hypothetical protein AUJ54_14625 [Ignavibacteria bacterium CG1_02_37_35]PIP77529.1 MAG: hypothetical protein COW85_08510 [Ignavibacteria bacterium CG22_combo_CG10-13_8_21_14_all_37_15]PIS45580.1 MAG: hypothetical protein COT22_04520 [Ignavibacteria bacterium CG08_land_8_20_14_0_20_37_9]PIW98767.1 MAG: hypothetical protein COZ80_08870 [Ignavibacteria bacterium CG_4_8_14_3_um_filter_37_9]PIX95142.1 MAG: hypothetical protein COZ25_